MTKHNKYDTPEKRFIRDEWLDASKKRLEINKTDFIKYLTLPGRECYDIIHMNGLLKKTEVGYDKDYLTFVEKEIEYITDIRNKLPRANYYQGTIEFFFNDALDGAEGKDSENKRLMYYNLFPFDVINLDFTKSPFKHGEKKTSPQMKAIHKLFELQKIRKHSFTLFLTFSGIKKADDNLGRIAVNNAIVKTSNEPQNKDFKKILDKKSSSPYYDNLKYKKFLLIGVPVIIINYGCLHHFNVKCTKRYTYIGSGNNAVMISMIFDCEFLSSNAYNGNLFNEITNKIRPKRLKEIFNHYEDINELFKRDKELKSKYSLIYLHVGRILMLAFTLNNSIKIC